MARVLRFLTDERWDEEKLAEQHLVDLQITQGHVCSCGSGFAWWLDILGHLSFNDHYRRV